MESQAIIQESGLTMADYLDVMLTEEKQVQNILLKDETKKCTYNQGYITQTVFGCHTCGANGGMCLACYLNCHLDHDTFEIGLKRNFRCDCGTEKFDRNPCIMNEDCAKTGENALNKYDHNFKAKFCICREDYNQDLFMIRCLHCLDFFHIYHLGLSEEIQGVVEGNDDYTQMICRDCVDQHYRFLQAYKNEGIYFSEEEFKREMEEEEKAEPAAGENKIDEPISLGKRSRSLEKECDISKKLQGLENQEWKQTLFVKENWNNNLCYCDDCQNLYKKNKIYEILSEELVNAESWEQPQEQETQLSQENSNNGLPQDDSLLYNQAMQELTKLDFMTQSVIASLYRDFYEDFKEFFEKFKEDNVLITQSHVQEFFNHIKTKRKETADV